MSYMKWYSPILLFFFLQNIHGQSGNANQGKLIQFVPTSFTNEFTLNREPVLKINSGDTILTETIDAGGFDKLGVRRQKGGNPLNGPFYVEAAKAGDVIAITFTRVSLNRSYAFTTESFVSRSLPKSITSQFKKTKLVKWKLDRENGFASPDTVYEHLREFRVPLNPFIGCIGLAPSNNKNEILSFFAGPYGGNMDFSRVRQSATIYLPVFHDGAFLYFGDGHAAQGDGELAGNALETSLDIGFTVRLIKQDSPLLAYPRIEDAEYLMAVGLDKSLDEALKLATSGLLDWLQHDYHLTLQESTQVLSTSIEYTIAEIADPDVEVVAKIKKDLLKRLRKF
jgi:amidase